MGAMQSHGDPWQLTETVARTPPSLGWAPLRCDGMSSGELSLSNYELARVSVALVDVDGVTRLENRAKVMCYAASIMKLAVAVAVLRKLDNGSLSPDDLLAYNGEFASGFDGSPFTIDDDSLDPELFSVDPWSELASPISASLRVPPEGSFPTGKPDREPWSDLVGPISASLRVPPVGSFPTGKPDREPWSDAQDLAGRDGLSEHAGIGEFAKGGEVFPAHWLRKLPGSRLVLVEAARSTSGDKMVSVARALRRSITVSSNEAANLLMQVVGLEAVNWVLLEAGCDNSVVERLVFDGPARDAGRTNMMTALDAAQLMWNIRFGTIAADDSLTYLCQVLRCQTQRSMIPFAVDGAIDRGEVVVGNKEGQTNEVLHDVAFIEPDDTDPFVLAVCTEGLTEAEATAAVRNIATYAYEHRFSWKSLSDNFR
jgi:beta-lactamase class A